MPNADGGIVEDGHAWVVQNRLDRIARIALARDLRSGVVEEVLTDEDLQVPWTAIRCRGRLVAVNARFGLTDAGPHEVVLVDDWRRTPGRPTGGDPPG